MPRIATLSDFLLVLKRMRCNIRDSHNGGHCQIVCWPSEADCVESKSDQMCEIRVTPTTTWPSRCLLCISMQWLRWKGCHVASDEWTSGEICSLQHMWVTGFVMWAAVSDESLKFEFQGASTTDFRQLTAREIMGFNCTSIIKCEKKSFVRSQTATMKLLKFGDMITHPWWDVNSCL